MSTLYVWEAPKPWCTTQLGEVRAAGAQAKSSPRPHLHCFQQHTIPTSYGHRGHCNGFRLHTYEFTKIPPPSAPVPLETPSHASANQNVAGRIHSGYDQNTRAPKHHHLFRTYACTCPQDTNNRNMYPTASKIHHTRTQDTRRLDR